MNPLADCGFESRTGTREAVRRLFEPVREQFSPGGARVRLGESGALFPETDAELEGFARPLWALAPLAAGGGAFDHWDLYREGLVNGTDPDHPEYWGAAPDYSQKHVEMAAVGLALAMAPSELWDPLAPGERERVAAWLRQTEDAALHDNNWRFFRVLVTAGLRSVGADHDWERAQETLDWLETNALTGGWYADGREDREGACDYYVAWSMHAYALIYAALFDDEDPERAARFRERAAAFAEDFRHWFAADGAALPYGRSLTYRFAQSAFWGALALADVDVESECEGLDWGAVRGLWARNCRWWADQPCFTDGGVLSIGYRYPSLKLMESYNSPSSPYWAMKAFLPLALPEDHPFWLAEEAPLPDTPAVVAQEHPRMVVCRSDDHHFALLGGQGTGDLPYGEKYAKFATSSTFGYSLAGRQPGLAGAGHDSLLALSRDGDRYRVRTGVFESSVEGEVAYSRWSLWGDADVTVETWLAPALPWHVRVHRLVTDCRVHSAEGGFALDRSGDDDPADYTHETGAGTARARYPGGESGVVDLLAGRDGEVVPQEPNTNNLYPRTVVPTLAGVHDPGEHWLACAVTAASEDGAAGWDAPPRLAETADGFRVVDGEGDAILRRVEDGVRGASR